MFKLVVLSALVAIVSARPSHLAAPLEYAAIAGPAVAIPAAVSHQSRTDIISKPVVATYAAAPVAVAHAAPVAVAHAVPIAVPAAVSHTARFDVHSSPLAWASVRAVPAVHALHAAPALHQW